MTKMLINSFHIEIPVRQGKEFAPTDGALEIVDNGWEYELLACGRDVVHVMCTFLHHKKIAISLKKCNLFTLSNVANKNVS